MVERIEFTIQATQENSDIELNSSGAMLAGVSSENIQKYAFDRIRSRGFEPFKVIRYSVETRRPQGDKVERMYMSGRTTTKQLQDQERRQNLLEEQLSRKTSMYQRVEQLRKQ